MTTYGEKFSAEEVKEMMSSAMDVDGKVCAPAMRVCGWISDSLIACCRAFSSCKNMWPSRAKSSVTDRE
jgi:hypothetical protein